MRQCVMLYVIVVIVFASCVYGGAADAQTAARGIPEPMPDHPGNVFLESEAVTVPLPKAAAGAARWRATDERGAERAAGAIAAGDTGASIAALGIGWYRVEFLAPNGTVLASTPAAVLARLAVPTPEDSPICLDSATAWFAHGDAVKQERFANLASLAGINWIRDRMTWGEAQTGPDTFTEQQTTYDTSCAAHGRHGLKTLQVHHSTPGWAVDTAMDGESPGKRFPRDLRHLYRFCEGTAKRYNGKVQAWEPWNEANIPGFGGHTASEMCALQKAAYLGYKAGDPGLTVGWNVFAGSGTALQTDLILANETWPYFDTYNIHTYDPVRAYLGGFETARRGACGRPIWLSECGIRLPFETGAPWGDLTHDNDLAQAAFIAKSYASSLFAGVDRHFFFILGNYLENEIQFGLLRHDLTPRPGYVALAAVGRLMAGAQCLGRVPQETAASAHIYAFKAKPDGRERGLLVAWADAPVQWPLANNVQVESSNDFLGRTLPAAIPQTLGPEPVFLVLATASLDTLNLEAPPERSEYREGAPSPVVFQASMPASATRLDKQAYDASPGSPTSIPVFVYNFGQQPVSGSLIIESAPAGWNIAIEPSRVALAPMERTGATVSLEFPASSRAAFLGGDIALRGDFGDAGRPVLVFRVAGNMAHLEPAARTPLAGANSPERWVDNIVGGASMTHAAHADLGILFDMRFATSDPWAFPRLSLQPGEMPDSSFDGLAFSIEILEGTGTVSVQFIESSGASYVANAHVRTDIQGPQTAFALFSDASWGSFSAPDANGRLNPEDIHTVLVGINSQVNSTVRMAVRDLAWVRY